MHIGGHFIIAAFVLIRQRRSTCDKDSGNFFHLQATQPALIQIHVLIDDLSDRISIQGLIFGDYQ